MICRVAETLGTPSDEELSWLPRTSDAYRFLRKVCHSNKRVPLQTLYPHASANCLDLIRMLLSWDPCQRLTATEAQEHVYLRPYLPKEVVEPPEAFDWSFDGFKATTSAVKERLYKECLRFHPDMKDRDGPVNGSGSTARAARTGGGGGYPSHSRQAAAAPMGLQHGVTLKNTTRATTPVQSRTDTKSNVGNLSCSTASGRSVTPTPSSGVSSMRSITPVKSFTPRREVTPTRHATPTGREAFAQTPARCTPTPVSVRSTPPRSITPTPIGRSVTPPRSEKPTAQARANARIFSG